MQVAKYCADSSMPDCNKNLLVAGMRNLANMDNNILDQLDPYQRDAKGLSKIFSFTTWNKPNIILKINSIYVNLLFLVYSLAGHDKKRIFSETCS